MTNSFRPARTMSASTVRVQIRQCTDPFVALMCDFMVVIMVANPSFSTVMTREWPPKMSRKCKK